MSQQRSPQSEQSVPSWQPLYSAPGPPSSQRPSEAQLGLPTQVSKHRHGGGGGGATTTVTTSGMGSTDSTVTPSALVAAAASMPLRVLTAESAADKSVNVTDATALTLAETRLSDIMSTETPRVDARLALYASWSKSSSEPLTTTV